MREGGERERETEMQTNFDCKQLVPPAELEPEHLREEKRCVLNSTQKLAFNNYATFIQTAECTREVFKDVSHMTIT